MDFSALGTSLQDALGTQLPRILGALGILIVGWLLAVVVRAGTRRLLSTLKVDARINESTGQEVHVESWIAIGLFWLIILITLIGVFNSLDLPRVSGPFESLVDEVLGYLPRLIAGALLAVLAWIVATVLRAGAKRLLDASSIDEKLSAGAGMKPMSNSVGNVLFWLVLLLFLPAILGVFDLRGLLDPVKAMVTKTLDMIPSIFAAFVIGFVGWLIARVLAGLVTNLLVAAGVDKTGAETGLGKSVRISKVIGTIVMVFVFVPALIAALDALKIEAISRPATDMLGKLLAAVPNIVGAALTLTITFFVARFAAQLLARLINGLGLDAMPEKLGLGSVFTGSAQPSTLAGTLVMFFAMLFATVEAANQLGFTQIRDVVTLFIKFGADVLLGGLILVVGLWLANVASMAISRTNDGRAPVFASLARVAILGLVIAMGLRAMGIADDIVNLAFGLTLGAIAVAVALSFGLGGREAAGRQMEYWLAKLRKEN
jgi:hypothetical protein